MVFALSIRQNEWFFFQSAYSRKPVQANTTEQYPRRNENAFKHISFKVYNAISQDNFLWIIHIVYFQSWYMLVWQQTPVAEITQRLTVLDALCSVLRPLCCCAPSSILLCSTAAIFFRFSFSSFQRIFPFYMKFCVCSTKILKRSALPRTLRVEK